MLGIGRGGLWAGWGLSLLAGGVWECAQAKAGWIWGEEPEGGECRLSAVGSGSASIQGHLGQTQSVTPGAHPEQIQPPVRISPQPSGDFSFTLHGKPPQLEVRVVLPTSVIQGIRDVGRGRAVAGMGLAARLAGEEGGVVQWIWME